MTQQRAALEAALSYLSGGECTPQAERDLREQIRQALISSTLPSAEQALSESPNPRAALLRQLSDNARWFREHGHNGRAASIESAIAHISPASSTPASTDAGRDYLTVVRTLDSISTTDQKLGDAIVNARLAAGRLMRSATAATKVRCPQCDKGSLHHGDCRCELCRPDL